MTTSEIINLLTNFEKRLSTIADQARETREQAQHTLDRVHRLVQDLEQLRGRIVSTAETSEHAPFKARDID